jgi:RNA polymerase sigma-70 factor (ECF subfamily)
LAVADYSQNDTNELLGLAQAGDVAATAEVLERFRPRLKTMVARRLDPRLAGRVDPSDVVQECLAAAHVRLNDYLQQQGVKFYPWLRSLAWDRLVDLHRRHVTAQRRSVRREVSIDASLSHESAAWLAGQLATSGTGPLQKLAQHEMAERVRRAMEQMSPALSEVLLLRYLEQLSLQEAAQVLGISQAALKQRTVRALRKIRDLLVTSDGAES